LGFGAGGGVITLTFVLSKVPEDVLVRARASCFALKPTSLQ
jgi:hypothetical protein